MTLIPQLLQVGKEFKMNFKKAFTLAEAILTMTILGIIATTMITTLKPSQYRTQGFNTMKKKLYAELDGVTQTMLVECAKNMSTTTIFNTCTRTGSTHSFGQNENAIYARFMKGTTGAVNTANSTCVAVADFTSLKLKNGACLYFGANAIKVDINGSEGPNEDGNDRMKITIDGDGISSDLDTAIAASW